MNAHPLIAHEQIPYAQNQDAIANGALSKGRKTFTDKRTIEKADHKRRAQNIIQISDLGLGAVIAVGDRTGKPEIPVPSAAAIFSFSINFHPPIIDESTPWPST